MSSLTATQSDDEDARECDRVVKTFDYENYLATMFLPDSVRRAVIAVRAYNVELATVRDSARGNVLTGRMRFQFWRETLNEIFGSSADVEGMRGSGNHPIGRALARAVREHGLQRRWLDRMLSAREEELENVEFSDINDFVEYAEAVGGSLMYLTLECSTNSALQNGHATEDFSTRSGGRPKQSASIGEDPGYLAAGYVGRAASMCNLLRSIPHTAENSQRFTIPFWVMSKHSVKREDFLSGQSSAEMRDCVLEVATAANNQLIDLQAMEQDVDDAVARCLLPATLAQDYLNRLELCDFDIFDPQLPRSRFDNVKMMLKLWRLQSKNKMMD